MDFIYLNAIDDLIDQVFLYVSPKDIQDPLTDWQAIAQLAAN